ncbi:MAG: FHA domain-containing protein [Cyanobacteriota bacterium]|nr:FHA domain-containing protein [Cyanobacteriota bacterium]
MKAYLKIYTPNGEEYETYPLAKLSEGSAPKNYITVGRKDEDGQFDRYTDLKLPATDQLISRKHFSIELKDGCYFWVKSLGSTHPTELKKAIHSSDDSIIYIGDEALQLQHGDRLLLRSKFPGEGNPYWAFCFYDPDRTESPNETYPPIIKYEYNLFSKMLVIHTSPNQKSQEIQYAGNELTIIRYIAEKVKETQNGAFLASYDDLILAVWPGDKQFGRSSKNLATHVSNINKKIYEKCGSQVPELIDGVTGHGYRLNNCAVKP